MMHRLLRVCLMALLGAGLARPAAGGDEPEPAAVAPGTVITSRSLSYDQNSREAVFDGDVVVTDPQLQIKADRLTVFFSADNQVQRLQAEDRVTIQQGEMVATGERADYDVTAGQVVLSVNPSVRRGRDLLLGEKITFWRDSGRVLCEPNARLVLYSERDMLSGATKAPGN